MEEQLNSVTPLTSSILWGEAITSTHHLILILIYNCGGLYAPYLSYLLSSASAAVTFFLWVLVRSAGCARLATLKILQ